MHTGGPVLVVQLPQHLDGTQAKIFLKKLEPLLDVDRPRLVLECSQVRHVDSAGAEMLLQCMQQAMKRDGDMKLAAVSPALGAFLELLRVDRLFEMLDTEKEAVQSFEVFQSSATQQGEPSYAPEYGGVEELKAVS